MKSMFIITGISSSSLHFDYSECSLCEHIEDKKYAFCEFHTFQSNYYKNSYLVKRARQNFITDSITDD